MKIFLAPSRPMSLTFHDIKSLEWQGKGCWVQVMTHGYWLKVEQVVSSKQMSYTISIN